MSTEPKREPPPSPSPSEGDEVAAEPSPADRAQGPPRPAGEIVEASTTELVAQCHRLYDAPALGSLVRTEDDSPVYGVVAEVSTGSIEPGRRPLAMARDRDTVDDIYDRNPQLGRLLATEFRSIVVAHRAGGALGRYLAPAPPRIHTPVSLCGPDEIRELTGSLEFLSVLVASPVGSPDDVTAAFLRAAGRTHPDPDRFLVEAGKEVATLLAGDVHRLNAVLRRLSQ